MMTYLLKTNKDLQKEIAFRFKQKRLDKNLTQEGLSERSGISLGTLKRFENTGEISLQSLLKIALVLNVLDEFDNLLKPNDKPISLINPVKIKQRKRGQLK
ncbi:helix-turn-helix transcriptional regulator [bacterium]|nr:helix-turn-helix transcriptional regulator [bacterium]